MNDYAAFLTPDALKGHDWSARVRGLMPETLMIDEEEFDDDEDPRELLEEICEELLGRPEAISHPAWGELVRAVVALSEDYRELTEDAYGEALDPNDAAEDEGGVVEMITELGLSTIGDALILLASPAAVARDDWAELVRYVLDEKKARFGTGPYLSSGWEEADELFDAEHVRAHPEVRELWRYADAILPLESEIP